MRTITNHGKCQMYEKHKNTLSKAQSVLESAFLKLVWKQWDAIIQYSCEILWKKGEELSFWKGYMIEETFRY